MSSLPSASGAHSTTESFDGMIGPQNLLGLVDNTASFLFDYAPTPIPPARRLIELGAGPRDFLSILQKAREWYPRLPVTNADYEDYFAMCLSAHHATVATFIPTDVDSKIRGLLWTKVRPADSRRRMFDLAAQSISWDVSILSTRWNAHSGVGPVSGHNGEQLGVLAGALGSFLTFDETDSIEAATTTIDAELQRESKEFLYVLKQKDMDIDLLRLSSSLTHNCGDLDQGIGYWTMTTAHEPHKLRFGRLAHENKGQYGKAFEIAATLYKPIMSPEGHRQYPLRSVAALRRNNELLLPLPPFLDDWGAKIAASKSLNEEEKAEVLAALTLGCKKIGNQEGYFRAISGFCEQASGRLNEIVKLMPTQARAHFKDSTFRQHIAIRKVSFESTMRKRAREILKQFGF